MRLISGMRVVLVSHSDADFIFLLKDGNERVGGSNKTEKESGDVDVGRIRKKMDSCSWRQSLKQV